MSDVLQFYNPMDDVQKMMSNVMNAQTQQKNAEIQAENNDRIRRNDLQQQYARAIQDRNDEIYRNIVVEQFGQLTDAYATGDLGHATLTYSALRDNFKNADNKAVLTRDPRVYQLWQNFQQLASTPFDITKGRVANGQRMSMDELSNVIRTERGIPITAEIFNYSVAPGEKAAFLNMIGGGGEAGQPTLDFNALVSSGGGMTTQENMWAAEMNGDLAQYQTKKAENRAKASLEEKYQLNLVATGGDAAQAKMLTDMQLERATKIDMQSIAGKKFLESKGDEWLTEVSTSASIVTDKLVGGDMLQGINDLNNHVSKYGKLDDFNKSYLSSLDNTQARVAINSDAQHLEDLKSSIKIGVVMKNPTPAGQLPIDPMTGEPTEPKLITKTMSLNEAENYLTYPNLPPELKTSIYNAMRATPESIKAFESKAKMRQPIAEEKKDVPIVKTVTLPGVAGATKTIDIGGIENFVSTDIAQFGQDLINAGSALKTEVTPQTTRLDAKDFEENKRTQDVLSKVGNWYLNAGNADKNWSSRALSEAEFGSMPIGEISATSGMNKNNTVGIEQNLKSTMSPENTPEGKLQRMLLAYTARKRDAKTDAGASAASQQIQLILNNAMISTLNINDVYDKVLPDIKRANLQGSTINAAKQIL